MLKMLKALYIVALAMTLTVIAGLAAAQEEQPDYSRKGADTCFQCHDDQATLAIFRSKHANPNDDRSPFGHGQLQCEACHGPGDDHAGRVRRGQERPAIPAFGFNSAASIAEQNEYCSSCHLGDTGFAWHGSTHDDNTVADVLHQIQIMGYE